MGVYRRPDSNYWWLWLETAPPGQRREKTAIRIGETVTERHDTKQLAKQVYHTRMQELGARLHRLPSAPPAIRFAVYAATYVTEVIVHHKGADRERELLRTLEAFFGADLLSKIDRDHVRTYMHARRQTVSANTVNREVDLLKAMLRDAVPKYLEASPLVGMKRLPIVKKRRRLLQQDEEARLLAVASDPQDQAVLVVGLDTLVRLGDLLDLQRSDRDGLWLMIRDPKSGSPYEVPLSPRAAAALDAITHDQPYFFEKFRRARHPRDWRGSVRQRLEWLCAKAKVPYGMVRGITFHGATRKTGATRLLIERQVPVAVVQKLGNWSTPDVLLGIYTEAERRDLLTAVGQPERSRRTRTARTR
jgi:integrase